MKIPLLQTKLFSSNTITVVFLVLILLVSTYVALAILKPLPARRIVFAAGSPGNAYYADALQYKKSLARHGVEVHILATNGSVENQARLSDPAGTVDAGFLQGGTTTAEASPNLASLGTVSYAPLWVFVRGNPQGLELAAIPGPRVSIGPEGSGTRKLSLQIIKASGIDTSGFTLQGLQPEPAANQLEKGELDAAFIMTGWESRIVHRLLARPDISLINFSRADAYIMLQPTLNKVILPAGVGSLASNRPPSDITLIAPKTSLVVRKKLHPALQYLLFQAAHEIHSGPDAFYRSGHFPAQEVIDLPISDEARHLYKSGPSFLQQHLPFWLAGMIQRLLALLIPTAGIIYPLILLLIKLYGWQINFRISLLYGELRNLETELRNAPPEAYPAFLEQLMTLEKRVKQLNISNRYSPLSYGLRSNIVLVRESLEASMRTTDPRTPTSASSR